MKNYLELLDPEIYSIIKKVGSLADKKGIRAYLIGGIVRDILLKRKNFDVDIVVDSDLIEFAQQITKLFKAKWVLHKAFHTASIFFPKMIRLDISSFRSETYARPGALPTVKDGTFQEDIARRDFTINALAIGINQSEFGGIIDPLRGLNDLKRKVIRVFHEKSFKDDPTRILRAVRFEQRFKFQIEQNTKRLLKVAVRKGYVNAVTPQRYFAEFKKILLEENPVKALKRLDSVGALSFIDNRVKWDFRFLKRVQKRTSLGLSAGLFNEGIKVWLVYFAALVKDLSDKQRQDSLSRFCFQREDKKTLFQVTKYLEMIDFLDDEKVRPSRIYRKLSGLTEEALFFLYVAAGRKKALNNISRFLKEFRLIRLRVTGDDVKRLGVKDGREIGKILNKVFDFKLDTGILTKQQESAIMKKIVKKGKL